MSALSIRNMNYAIGERELEPTPFPVRWNVALEKLLNLMSDEEFTAFWDAHPETMTKREFLPIMQAKIVELSKPQATHSKGQTA